MSTIPERAHFRYFDRLRVRWAEVDMQKIVFNGHYLMYADTAVAGYWRALALPYHETMEALQGDLYVRKATLEYMASARYDDVLDVGIRTASIGTSSMRLHTAIFCGPRLLVHGELVYVFACPRTQTSRPVPDSLRQCLLGFEAGQPALRLDTGTWQALGEDCKALREDVLVHELGLPPQLIEDERDPSARHAVVRNRMGRVLACARVVQMGAGLELQRLVVCSGLRRAGVGRWLVQALQQGLRCEGFAIPGAALRVQAHTSATDFWRSVGFTPEGEPFGTLGVSHQTWQLRL
jgi:YbgC/YbaW family acyl-CoA thioester hydrolase